MRTCPYCTEEIQEKAIKCRHCGEMLNKEKKAEISKGFVFTYKAKNVNREYMNGTIRAMSQNDALEKLDTQGLFVISIKMVEKKEKKSGVEQVNKVAPAIEGRTCPNCGASLGIKATKCPQCKKSICANCGNILGFGVNKCPKCGAATGWGALQGCGCLLFVIGLILLTIVAVLIIL